MHLVEAAGQRILLDCGLVRGPRTTAVPYHGHFPFAPSSLDAVVLSHAHIDHCGNLPNLVKQGFAGPIYCTPATQDLIGLMLAHSARTHDEEALVHNVLRHSVHPEFRPAFTHSDVDQTLRQCIALPYGQARDIGPGIRLCLRNAGHLLGSAMVALTITQNGQTGRLTFTGDLGRHGAPLVGQPAPVPAADLLLSESTYGGRVLNSLTSAASELEVVVRRTVERGGKVLIPTFSLGRSQVLVYCLRRSLSEGRLPEVPIIVDSRQAADIAEVYRRHRDCLDEDTARRFEQGEDVLNGEMVHYVRSSEESQELTNQRGPAVILAPSGMCEGGRIVHHLKHHLDDPRCSVVLVNYQAPHTPGHRLLERGPTIRFHGRKWNKWADIVYLAGFSGHADHNELLAWLGPLAGQTAKVCLVHGEPQEAALLAQALHEEGFASVKTPDHGETVAIV
jgi:metallo-beta-lactamase family protein